MQRSIMGFGSIATAFYLNELISETTLNESHGISNPRKSDMCYFHERLEAHKYVCYSSCESIITKTKQISRQDESTEYATMKRAVRAVYRQFPDIGTTSRMQRRTLNHSSRRLGKYVLMVLLPLLRRVYDYMPRRGAYILMSIH